MSERIVMVPQKRRAAVIEVIRAAQRQLRLSLFRCRDGIILEELAAASARGVRVEVLLTPRARGWRRKLRDLGETLESAGIVVHRYPVQKVRYHAKYMIADETMSMVGSLNYTPKCFSRTCDFVLLSGDPVLASDLTALFEADCAGEPAPESGRLIVGPEYARDRISGLLESARGEIAIVDHRLKDPRITSLLDQQEQNGISVRVVGRDQLCGLAPHGKLLLIDREIAVLGSLSLRPASLNRRRELAVIVHDFASIQQLVSFFDRCGSVQLERAA